MCDDINETGDAGTSERTTNEATEPTTVRHEWREADQPSMSLVEAVAAATDRTPADLPPLQRSIDADALNTLLTQGQSPQVTISFEYADTGVWIDGDGTIEIQLDGSPTAEDGYNSR